MDITVFGPDQNGARAVQFHRDGLTVLVRPSGAEQNADAHALAIALDSEASSIALLDALLSETRQKHSADVRSLLARIPPKRPTRLLGTGVVRFDEKGRPWLLNRRDRGWGEFGVYLDDWDDLFRRYNVRITAHGTDKHGPWWEVEPCGGSHD